MTQITQITLSLPLRMGSVNCYLLHNEAGYFLIDTGVSSQRARLEAALQSAGCQPGQLKLILLTHGDFDHTGSAASLRTQYSAPIAMHPDDWGMLEQGDMFYNRKQGNPLIRSLAPKLIGFGKSQRCTPDLALVDGYDLSPYGLAAQVLSIPGHSRGSVAVLTAQGELFCGDLLENTAHPALGSIMDDPPTAAQSLARLRALGVTTVYPGHGTPFALEQL